MNKHRDIRNQLNVNSIVIGCNYHTKWQSNKDMRFVLIDVIGNKARLQTRRTKKDFWTNVSDLIFIMSDHNLNKAVNILVNTHKQS